MELVALLRTLRRNLVLIVAMTLLGTSIGATTAMLTPQRFESSTQLLIKVQTRPGAASYELTQANSYATQVVETYRSLVTSSLVLEPVIEDLGLDTTVAALGSRVRASVAQSSTAVTITVSGENPGEVSRLANTIGASFADAVTGTLEARDDDASFQLRVVVLQAAQVPLTPVAPNLRLSLVLGLLLGFGAGIGIALLRAVLDTRIRTLHDLEQSVEAPVLGGTALDPNAAKRPLIVATDPLDPRAEAYRSLRTSIRFLFPASGSASFLVTSSGPGEGKTMTASNIAIAFAESGYRTVIVDADLRLPRVAERFGIEGGVGLSDVLAGRVELDQAVQRWGRGTLFVLASGSLPPNPAELVGSDAMRRLVNDLGAAFDVIIIDAPPALLVTDAPLMSRIVDGTLLVAAAGKASKPMLTEAVKTIEAAGGAVRGSIITMVPTTGADRTAYGTYAYTAEA